MHFVSFFQKQILTCLCCSISVLFCSTLTLGCVHSAFRASCELYGLVLGCPVCLQLTCCGSLPCLLVLSPFLLFSRLNGSGETLGRKKTNFLQKPVPSSSCLSALLGSAAAAASRLVFGVGDTPAPPVAAHFSSVYKDQCLHLEPSRLQCLADWFLISY